MKALRFYAPEDVRLEDVPEPDCGTRRDQAAGPQLLHLRHRREDLLQRPPEPHSPTDHRPRDRRRGRRGRCRRETTYGSDWQVGDRVQVIAAVPCGECYECKKGWMAVCPNQTSIGYQYDGGFAEYMIVPRQVLKVDGLNRIPDNVGFAEASVAEPFACVINGQELARHRGGRHVVVFGAGPIGCMHIRLARGVRGAGPVFLVDLNAERLKMSAEAVSARGDHRRLRGRRRRARHGAHRRPRRRRRHHRGGRQRHPGAGDRDGRAQRPDLLLRRPAQGQPDHHLRLQPRALPRAAHPRRQRLGARAQQAGAGVHLDRPGAGQGPDHPPHPPRRRALAPSTSSRRAKPSRSPSSPEATKSPQGSRPGGRASAPPSWRGGDRESRPGDVPATPETGTGTGTGSGRTTAANSSTIRDT